jgi:signal transduction histidine kinase
LRRHLLIPPLVLLLLVLGLLAFSGQRVWQMRAENEALHTFNLAVADAEAAQSALQAIDDLVDQMMVAMPPEMDDLHFRYLDLYRTFEQHAAQPRLQEVLSPDARSAVQQLLRQIAYSEQLVAVEVDGAVHTAMPVLDAARRALWTGKRDVYEQYNANVQAYTTQLSQLYLGFLALSLVVGVPLVLWFVRAVEERLTRLARQADELAGGEGRCSGNRLDALESSLQGISRRLKYAGGGDQLLGAVDEERRRIAHDMHDEVLSGITGLIREADAGRDEAPELAQRMRNGLEHLSSDIRRVIDDLHPPVLETLGWEAALRAYLDRIADLPGTPEVTLGIEPNCAGSLDEGRRATVYRIVREVVNNVLRHARATRLEIDCHRNPEGLTLLVDDNGEGKLPLREGRGINGIRYRAAAMGGDVQWTESRFSSGLRFTLTLPVS